jgi:hypothetical protein
MELQYGTGGMRVNTKLEASEVGSFWILEYTKTRGITRGIRRPGACTDLHWMGVHAFPKSRCRPIPRIAF